jgi:hypothetical protein
MSFIYVLKLMHNKYYIGKAVNVVRRIGDHFSGNGSRWTKLHHPLEVIEVYRNCNGFDEDYFTKQYMVTHGLVNVRGGSYCNIILSNNEIQILKKEIDTALDRCFVCGSIKHMASYCEYRQPNVKPIDTLDTSLYVIDKEPDYSLLRKKTTKIKHNSYILGQNDKERQDNPKNIKFIIHNKWQHKKAKNRKRRRKRKNNAKKQRALDNENIIIKSDLVAVKNVTSDTKWKSKSQTKKYIENRLKIVMKERPGYNKVDFCIICFNIGHRPEKCHIYDQIYS